jgi:pimeloyl-ACP methyl ester carboxylesterase
VIKQALTVCSALIALSGLGTSVLASDILKERRWAEQISDALLVGEAIQLNAEGRDFLALYAPASGKQPHNGVLLLHGLGAHPDWPDVIAPLRQELPEAGWATLSLQLPIRPNDAEFDEYLPLFPAANARIGAGIQYLQQQGIRNIAIVGHSLGAAMGAHFLALPGPGAEQVQAFVGIGMNQRPGSVAHTPDAVGKIAIPVLDLYGSQDLDGVLASARPRASAASNNAGYRQKEVLGADHFFRGMDSGLVKLVGSWLTANAPGSQLEPKTSSQP